MPLTSTACLLLAGTGSFLDSEDKETAYIPATALAEEANYMLEVRGDSM